MALNLLLTAGAAGMSTMRVVKGMPRRGILFTLLTVTTCIPWLSTFMPDSLMGPEGIIQ